MGREGDGRTDGREGWADVSRAGLPATIQPPTFRKQAAAPPAPPPSPAACYFRVPLPLFLISAAAPRSPATHTLMSGGVGWTDTHRLHSLSLSRHSSFFPLSPSFSSAEFSSFTKLLFHEIFFITFCGMSSFLVFEFFQGHPWNLQK